MRLWSSKLGQGTLWRLVYVDNCYILVYLNLPSLSSCFLIFFRGGLPPPSLTPPPPTCLCTESSAHLGVTCLRPSMTMPPVTTLLISAHTPPPLQPSLAPVLTYRFLSPPHPCLCQNCFHRNPQLVFHLLLPPPHHLEYPSSFIPHLSHTHIKNRPGVHPLRHYCMSPSHICP